MRICLSRLRRGLDAVGVGTAGGDAAGPALAFAVAPSDRVLLLLVPATRPLAAAPLTFLDLATCAPFHRETALRPPEGRPIAYDAQDPSAAGLRLLYQRYTRRHHLVTGGAFSVIATGRVNFSACADAQGKLSRTQT